VVVLSNSTSASAGCSASRASRTDSLAKPCAENLVVRVTGAQAQQQPLCAVTDDAFTAGDQQFADPVEGIKLAAAVAELFVLHPTADLVDTPVGGSYDVEQG
jgi:hypothetical protein